MDNKLSIHFGEDKTKSILFTSKNNIEKIRYISYSSRGHSNQATLQK